MARHGMRAVGFWADVDPQWQITLHAIRRDRSAVSEVAMARLTSLPGLPPAAKHGDMR
jgi:hypothetical protein